MPLLDQLRYQRIDARIDDAERSRPSSEQEGLDREARVHVIPVIVGRVDAGETPDQSLGLIRRAIVGPKVEADLGGSERTERFDGRVALDEVRKACWAAQGVAQRRHDPMADDLATSDEAAGFSRRAERTDAPVLVVALVRESRISNALD